MNDRDTLAVFTGLGRTVVQLAVCLVEQRGLDREATIRSFRLLCDSCSGDDPADKTTKMWANQVAEALEADPERPPPALVIPLRPHDTDNSGGNGS